MSAMIQQASVLTGRQLVLAATIALHVLAISALMAMRIDTGQVARELRLVLALPVQEPVPPEEAPPVPQVREASVRTILDFPVPVPQFQPEVSSAPLMQVVPVEQGEAVTAGEAVQTGTSGAGPAPIAPTELQFRAVRSTDDYYPLSSRQLGEEGVVVLRVCVGAAGNLQGTPEVQRSSGSARLDRAATQWAREALRFTPATADGVPVAACKGFRVNFTLH